MEVTAGPVLMGSMRLGQWPQSFDTAGAAVFVVGSGIVFLIAGLIVGINAFRAASENPVTALRME